MLEEARVAYIKGFSPGHSKVAWALEGKAKVYQKVGEPNPNPNPDPNPNQLARLQASARVGHARGGDAGLG